MLRLLTLTALLLTAASASAESITACGRIVPITEAGQILYKPTNVHGGRGPTFLVQNYDEQTGRKRREIRRATDCKRIGYFGLWSIGWPYGERYYQRAPGGSRLSAKDLYTKAGGRRKSAILVQGINGRWIRIANPLKREGEVYNP